MASKRRHRRQQYQSRPIRDKSTGMPPIPQVQAPDPTAEQSDMPVMPQAGIPNTGMPMSVSDVGQFPAVNPPPEDQGYARGGIIKPPSMPTPALMPDPSGYSGYTPVRSDPVARRRYSSRHVGYAEGGAISANGADPRAYLNGDNAIAPEHLDAILQQISQLDPSKGEDAVNLTAIVQAAQSGDMDQAASILAGFRRRFDSLNAHAQGAVAHGDLAVAAKLAGKAHSQVPDGMTVNYAVAPNGSGVTATVSPSGQIFQMNGQQFHDYLVGPATSFDHILENGLEKNLAIASGRQSGQGAPVVNPAPTGYAAGGAVTDPRNDRSLDKYTTETAGTFDVNDPNWKSSLNYGRYQEGGSVEGTPGCSSDPRSSKWTLDCPVSAKTEGGTSTIYGDKVARGEGKGLNTNVSPVENYYKRGGDPANIQFGPGFVKPEQKDIQYGSGYQEGGEVQEDYAAPSMQNDDPVLQQQQDEELRRRREQEQRQAEQASQQTGYQPDDSPQIARQVLERTRQDYGLGGGGQDGPSREDIASETSGLGLGGDRVAPLTGDETKTAFATGMSNFSPSSIDNSTAGAGGIYMGPGGGGGGGGGGGQRRHRPSGGGVRRTGGGGGVRRTGGGDRSGGGDTSGTVDAVSQDIPYNYTTGYKQEPPTYTAQPPGTDLRRTDVENRPIGPPVGEPVPPEAAAEPLVRKDTQGRPIGGVDTRPDPNDPREYAKREFPNDPAGQNAVLANNYLRGSQHEYDTLRQASENRTLTPDSAERLAELERGRKEATYDWDGFAKSKGLKSAEQIIQEAQQPQRGGGRGARDPNRADPNYGRTVLDPDGWPTGVPRGGTFANIPGVTATRDYSEPISFGRRGGIRRGGSEATYDVNGQSYAVDPRTGLPRPRHFQQGFQGPVRGQPGWTGTYPANRPAAPAAAPTYQIRPVAPQSQAPVPAAGPNATVGENAPPYQVAGANQPPPSGGNDWSQPVPRPVTAQRGSPEDLGIRAARVAHANPDPNRMHTMPSGQQISERELNEQADYKGPYQTSPSGRRVRAEFVQKLENTRREYAGLDPNSYRARELAAYAGEIQRGLTEFDRTGWWGKGGRGYQEGGEVEDNYVDEDWRMAPRPIVQQQDEARDEDWRMAPRPIVQQQDEARDEDWRMAPRLAAQQQDELQAQQVAGDPNDPENAAPYQVAGKDWVAPPTAATAPAADGGAPAAQAPEGPPPGAVFNDRTGWQPAPNIRGSSAVAPPPSDQSPAAQAARAFPSADQQSQRQAYQARLERQVKTDQLEREKLTTKDTPADKMARQEARNASAEFRTLSTLDQKNAYLEMKNTWENNRLAQHAIDTVERSGNAGMAEILKNWRTEKMANPDAEPNEIVKGAMYHAYLLQKRAPTTATPAAAPAGTRQYPGYTAYVKPDGTIGYRKD